MSKSVNKYRIFCNTENKYTYSWDDTLPTKCPTDGSHTIDTTTISVIDTINTSTVNINQENVPTGGNYRAESKKVTIAANSTQSFDFVWPYPISVLTMTFFAGEENHNDILDTFVAPDTIIGVVVAQGNNGDTVVHVNQTVTDNIKIGYRVNFTDGMSKTFVGECIAIDKQNGTVTLDTPLATAVMPGTYLSIAVNNVKNFILKSGTKYELARKTIGASYVPTNTLVRLQYQNVGEAETDFFFSFEILY